MLTKLVRHLDRSRFASTVVSMTDRGVMGDVIEQGGTEVLTLGVRRGVPDPRALFRLRSLLRQRQPDVVQSWMYHADVLSALACRNTGIPVLWNVRCSEVERRDYSIISGLTIRAAARLSHLPSGVVVNSMAGRDYHHRIGFRPRAWHFIPNGFDLERFRPNPDFRREVRRELGLADDTPLVGMLARFDPMKDHANFFEAAAAVARQTPAHFLLAGEGVTDLNPDLLRLRANPDLAGRVHLLGYRRDVETVLAALDVHVLSSAYGEGFPNVIGEAMACGVTCVTTSVGDAAEIVGADGFVVPRRDAAALVRAIMSAVTLSPSERLVRGRSARERIQRQFSMAAIISKYENLYASVARKTKSTAASDVLTDS
jgi:glycosyltransferase involved in cell wall biosynthesis